MDISNTIDSSLENFIKSRLGKKSEIDVKTIIYVKAEKKDYKEEIKLAKHFPEFIWDFITME